MSDTAAWIMVVLGGLLGVIWCCLIFGSAQDDIERLTTEGLPPKPSDVPDYPPHTWS